jgi:hypothetical protein
VTGELRPVQPRRSTAWARSLGIRERVSAFTTMHKPGQPRVRNIHRAADLLRGQLVLPGERFSLNRAIGPRTPARGFVTAPVITRGEFSHDVGSGVSQVATTFFNAVFFGGYRIVSHQPHSYYIKRYPMGREATVSLPAPDLVFVNDSRAGILTHTSYTDTAITVTFYGDRAGRRVRAEGPRILATRPPEGTTEYLEDPKLPRGTQLVEPAFTGYDVEVFRVIIEPGKPTRRERFVTPLQQRQPQGDPRHRRLERRTALHGCRHAGIITAWPTCAWRRNAASAPPPSTSTTRSRTSAPINGFPLPRSRTLGWSRVAWVPARSTA